jgi:purine-binding chemotaxis protein CheW
MKELFVIFEIDRSAYAIAARQVVQMESFGEATPVPGAPGHVRGLVHVRGRPLPVVDVRVRFGLAPAPPSLDRRLIVVEQGGRSLALLVDRAREVASMSDEDFQPPPDMVTREGEGFVGAVAQVGERVIMRVNLDEIIGEEEAHERQRTA